MKAARPRRQEATDSSDLVIDCLSCGRQVGFDLRKVISSRPKLASASIEEITTKLRCSKCGERRVKVTVGGGEHTRDGGRNIVLHAGSIPPVPRPVSLHMDHRGRSPFMAPDSTMNGIMDLLASIAGSILQVSNDKMDLFVSSLAGKGVGGAASAGLMSLVGSFGTASTGTAISTLSGAAATSSTLAWIGGLVGGGMVAGTAVVGGVGVAAGIGAVYYLKGSSRPVEALSERELGIISACRHLAPFLKAISDHGTPVSAADVACFRGAFLRPLLVDLDDYLDREGRGNLTLYHHVRLKVARQRLEASDRQLAKLPPASRLVMHPAAVVAGVLSAVLTDQIAFDTVEGQLVLEAIRRSSPVYAEMSEGEIYMRICDMGAAQLQGFQSNIKGIYHELVYAHAENTDGDGIIAELYPATSHPGADVCLFSDGELIGEIQLKATENAGAVVEHIQNYPGIPILATEGLASRTDLAGWSGFDNEELSREVEEGIDGLDATDEVIASAAIGAGTGALSAAAISAYGLIRGETDLSGAGKRIAEAAGIAGMTSALVAWLFS